MAAKARARERGRGKARTTALAAPTTKKTTTAGVPDVALLLQSLDWHHLYVVRDA
jgi:hypothetical protein